MDDEAPFPSDSEGWEETQYESLDWGGDDENGNRLVELYPSTSKPAQAALALLVAGFILLVAMIGAIILTMQAQVNVRRQQIFQQVSRNMESAVFLVNDKETTKN